MKNHGHYHVIGIATILILLGCLGFYLFTEWDLQRFNKTLGESPIFSVDPEPIAQRRNLPKDASEETEHLVPEGPKRLENPIVETEAPTSENDAYSLSHLDLFLGEFDNTEDTDPTFADIETPTIEAEPIEVSVEDLKPSDPNLTDFLDLLEVTHDGTADTEIISEVLNRLNNGTATSQEVITMANAWLRILPEDDYQSRSSIEKFLNDEYELRKHSETEFTEIISVEYDFRVYIPEDN